MGSHQPIRKIVVPEPVAIPDKLYFRIGDVARLCDVEPYVLRFWETEFSQLKPNKGGTGQRLYRKKDVEVALRIKGLLYEQGYTIPGARQILKGGAATGDPAAEPAARSAPHLAVEARASTPAPPQEGFDRGPELRLRAQLADLRDDLQSLLAQLSAPKEAGPMHAARPAEKPRPRLMLEPRPAPKAPAQTTLHLTTQGGLFGAE